MSSHRFKDMAKSINTKIITITFTFTLCIIFSSLITSSYSIDVFNTPSNSSTINGNNSNTRTTQISVQDYDKLKNCTQDQHTPTNGITYLTHFSCGHVNVLKNGTTMREFTLIAQENTNIPIANNGLTFNSSWTYNGSIPGPTMRMTEGDIIHITLINSKDSMHAHSIHMHSIHDGTMDGIPGASGNSGLVEPGHSFTYSFIAQPFGVYPYHCHVEPVDEHINQGLYGMMIIDPKTPRPQMTEMAMLMNGYNLNYSGVDRIPTVDEVKKGEFPENNHANQVYTVNGVAFEYMDHPIHLETGKPYRIYLVNMLEFDALNNFHLHGNLFNYYPSGTSLKPEYKNDMVDMMQGDRGILEFTYNFPGMFMFHAHKTEFTMKGWMGMFNVTKPDGRGLENVDLTSNTNTKTKNNFNSTALNGNQTAETSHTPTKTTTNGHSGSSNGGLVGV
ncbi:MAG: multicopper oxidase domain-containing protein [Candidatus Nitrosocosmicus sp.]